MISTTRPLLTAVAVVLALVAIGAGCGGTVTFDDGGDGDDDGAGGAAASGAGAGGDDTPSGGTGTGGRASDTRVAPCDGGEAWVALDGSCGGRTPCFAAIQDAVDAAAPWTTIWVAPGTYLPSGGAHVIDATVAQVCVRSEQGPASTILDGQELGTTVLAGYDGALWLEGFTVRGGGRSTSQITDGYGVAMGGWESVQAWVVGNVIEDNLLGRGGLLIDSGTVDNELDVLVARNVVRRNVGETIDGAVHVSLNPARGLLRIENNLIVDNEPTGLAVVTDAGDDASLRLEVSSNTIVGHALGMRGTLSVLAVENNISWGNDEDVRQNDYDPPSGVRWNLFGASPELVGVNDNFSADPLFVALGADYHLQPASPACGVGSPDLAPPHDREGVARDPAAPGLGAHACP